jgi:hypothetical protein
MKLHETLRAEIRRVARNEDKSIEELVDELKELTDYSVRQIYNFKCGKWDIPSRLIPVLCKRFGSRALLSALADECSDTRVEVPELFDLGKKVAETLRDDMGFYLELVKAFEDGVIQPHELVRLRELSEKCQRGQVEFLEIAGAAYERSQKRSKGSLDHAVQ